MSQSSSCLVGRSGCWLNVLTGSACQHLIQRRGPIYGFIFSILVFFGNWAGFPNWYDHFPSHLLLPSGCISALLTPSRPSADITQIHASVKVCTSLGKWRVFFMFKQTNKQDKSFLNYVHLHWDTCPAQITWKTICCKKNYKNNAIIWNKNVQILIYFARSGLTK